MLKERKMSRQVDYLNSAQVQNQFAEALDALHGEHWVLATPDEHDRKR